MRSGLARAIGIYMAIGFAMGAAGGFAQGELLWGCVCIALGVALLWFTIKDVD
jgi:hypothetical protein